MNKPALLLINLGTPDSPSYLDVFKYLREFLMDARVIDVPYILRFLLVTLIICPFRSFSSSKIYQKLWDLSGGVSPLLKNTEELTKKLNHHQDKFNVFYAMRYQSPSIEQALQQIRQTNPSELIIFLFSRIMHLQHQAVSLRKLLKNFQRNGLFLPLNLYHNIMNTPHS